jgi:DNA polymerase-3 subunit beta
MKFTTESQTLAAALKKVGAIVEARNTIPVLSNLLITADHRAGTVAIRGTDLDVEVVTKIKAHVESSGSITAPAYMLESYVSKSPKGSQIEIELIDAQLACHQGRSKVRMQTLPAEDFPDLAHGDMTHAFEMEAAQFAALFNNVRFAMSTEETRYYLNGIYLHPRANEAGQPGISACATDGHRLALAHQPMADPSIQGFPGIIVPRKTVLLLIKLCEGCETASVAYSGSKIRVELGAVTVTSKLIDGTFPDYERVIPRGNNKVASIDRAKLQVAVDRVSTISSDKGRATRFEFGDGKLLIGMTDSDRGTAAEDIDVTYDAGAETIGFNSRYVMDILGAHASEVLDIAIADAGSPVTVKTSGDPNRVCVLMPLRV